MKNIDDFIKDNDLPIIPIIRDIESETEEERIFNDFILYGVYSCKISTEIKKEEKR